MRAANELIESKLNKIFKMKDEPTMKTHPHFTFKVAMTCSSKQFFEEARLPLLNMGYAVVLKADFSTEWICNCIESESPVVKSFPMIKDITHNSPGKYFGVWDAKLFLALAAMNDNPDGGYGTWWKCVDSGDAFCGRFFIQSGKDFSTMIKPNGMTTNTGWWLGCQDLTKATPEEVIEFILHPQIQTEAIPGRALTNVRYGSDDPEPIPTATIPIPKGHYASVKDNCVIMLKWIPKAEEKVYRVKIGKNGFEYDPINFYVDQMGRFSCGLIVRTENEAVELVNRLNDATK